MTREESLGERPLAAHDLEPVPLQGFRVCAGGSQPLPFADQSRMCLAERLDRWSATASQTLGSHPPQRGRTHDVPSIGAHSQKLSHLAPICVAA